MDFEAERAIDFFRNASAHLPAEDRKSMAAAEIMRGVYRRLLARMQADRFDVFRKRYALNKLEKAAVILRVLIGNFLNRAA